ncbi:MAG: hypothetical protein FJX80_00060 [Bacteroidetes bacterium]|nr:hypothetical protein [Bacteroidota bacterium]
MKATLEFNLPEDNSEHLRAVNAGAAWSALHDIDTRLRSILKYGLDKDSSYEKELADIRSEINDTLALLGEV